MNAHDKRKARRAKEAITAARAATIARPKNRKAATLGGGLLR